MTNSQSKQPKVYLLIETEVSTHGDRPRVSYVGYTDNLLDAADFVNSVDMYRRMYVYRSFKELEYVTEYM